MKHNKHIILVIGAAVIVLGLLLYIALLPTDDEIVRESPYVKELEAEADRYETQADSLNAVIHDLNARIDTVRAQMDSARTSNKTLLTSLNRVTNEMKEYQRLYKEQRALSDRLRREIGQIKADRDRATTQVEQLKTSVDSLNNVLSEQTVRLTRMASSLQKAHVENRALRDTLKEAHGEIEELQKTLQSVLVYVGIEDTLKQQGYLNTSRIIRKNYKMANFPDLDNSDIIKVGIGETFTVQGKLAALCDRHGKLGKGKEYELSQAQSGQTLISFSDATLAGQRVLVVLKN